MPVSLCWFAPITVGMMRLFMVISIAHCSKGGVTRYSEHTGIHISMHPCGFISCLQSDAHSSNTPLSVCVQNCSKLSMFEVSRSHSLCASSHTPPAVSHAFAFASSVASFGSVIEFHCASGILPFTALTVAVSSSLNTAPINCTA